MRHFILLCLSLTVAGLSAQERDVLDFSLSTPWTETVDQEMPWNVYPRPQLTRPDWTNLNGQWDYAIAARGAGNAPGSYDGKILVPFAVESALSNVKKLVGADNYLWYRRNFTAPRLADGERAMLHFGAVDFEAAVYVNGELVGGHSGGYTPFSFDVTDYLKGRGRQELVVRVWDPTDEGPQPRGKQVNQPQGIYYTPVTGIWQTVWLETVPPRYISDLKVTPNVDAGAVDVVISTEGGSTAGTAEVTVTDADGQTVATQSVPLTAGTSATAASIELDDAQLWSPENPYLYDLQVKLSSGDAVGSYVGMRKISLGKDANGHTVMLLNDAPYFQFGPLDQGWWPDGLYTAPTPEALVYDVEMTKKWGFNMLRKHVKVEPAIFYRACDSLGMLVWQDMPSSSVHEDSYISPEAAADAERPYADRVAFEREYKEMIDAFHDYPSIVIWVPFNEGWGQYDTERIADWTRAYDPTRLVDAPSGWTDRGAGDMYDAHLYPGPGMEAPEDDRASVLGEYGGLGLVVEDHLWWDKRNWGYQSFKTPEELNAGFRKLTEGLIGLRAKGLAAAVYTQTTDVEGEVNGLMTYDRKVVKVDTATAPDLFAPLYAAAPRHLPLVTSSETQPQRWRMSESEDGDLLQDGTLPADARSRQVDGPFNTFTNFFQPKGTGWDTKQYLYLTRTFRAGEVPEHLYAEYINRSVDFTVYLNGEEIMDVPVGGGGFGHYTVQRIDAAKQHLREGTNTLTVRVKGVEDRDRLSFDLGLFGTAGGTSSKR